MKLLWFLICFFLFCGSVTAAENLGLYTKIAEDSQTSTYALVWSTYDPVISYEPVLPEDFVLPQPDGSGCVEGLCPLGVDLEEMYRIVVIGLRPALSEFWAFNSGSNGGTRVGRDTQFGGLGSGPGGYARIGGYTLTPLQVGELLANTMNATIQQGLRDVAFFRADGSHVSNPQGSVIPWQTWRVNWNLYGAGNPALSDQQVFDNFRFGNNP